MAPKKLNYPRTNWGGYWCKIVAILGSRSIDIEGESTTYYKVLFKDEKTANIAKNNLFGCKGLIKKYLKENAAINISSDDEPQVKVESESESDLESESSDDDDNVMVATRSKVRRSNSEPNMRASIFGESSKPETSKPETSKPPSNANVKIINKSSESICECIPHGGLVPIFSHCEDSSLLKVSFKPVCIEKKYALELFPELIKQTKILKKKNLTGKQLEMEARKLEVHMMSLKIENCEHEMHQNIYAVKAEEFDLYIKIYFSNTIVRKCDASVLYAK